MPPKVFHVPCVKTHTSDVSAMCSGGKSGKVYASGGKDRMLYLWCVDYDTPVLHFGPFASEITCLQFNKNEDVIAVGTYDGTISLIDLDRNETVCSWHIDQKRITSICIHPRLPFGVYAGDEMGRIFLFSHPKTEPTQIITAHNGRVNSIAISTVHGLISSCGDDNTIRLFDLQTNKSLGVIRSNLSPVTSVAFHPKEKILASCSADRYIKLFDLNRTYEMDGSFIIGRSMPTSIEFSTDGECVVACSPSGISIIKVHDTKFSDHMTLSLSTTYNVVLLSTCIAITSSYGSNAKYILLNNLDFPLLRPRNETSKNTNAPYQVLLRDNSMPVHIFDQSAFPDGTRIPARKVQQQFHEKFLAEIQLNRKQPPPSQSDPQIYKEFSTDRKTYMEAIITRLRKMNEIRDVIKKRGTEEAISMYSHDVTGRELEFLSLLAGRKDTPHIENAVNLLRIAMHATELDGGEEKGVEYMYEVLTNVAPIMRVSLTEPHTIEIISVAHSFKTKLTNISTSGRKASETAAKILSEFSDLL